MGVPIGACNSDELKLLSGDADLAGLAGADSDAGRTGDVGGTQDVAAQDFATQDMSPQEIEDFVAEVDTAAEDLRDDFDSGDPSRIPPGQHAVESFPVLGSNPDPATQEAWRLTVSGEVETPLELTWTEFEALPQVDLTCDIHCVTGWTLLNVSWAGVAVSHLLSLAQTNDNARFVVFDCENGYSTSIPIEEALKPNVLVATKLFGSPLPTEHGGLARGLVPDLYFYKSGKWVTGLRVLEQDELGFWESRGYSNSADPWNEERYGGDE